ncbi:monocarboxylate transporter 6 [Sinocyclocheilus grahami]|uniref:monocarboxylate transporter 6 n=1 Tax=Sinocyclocheilus grahami TaxID=75366 RepID=UPI0007AD2B34|nr:PREDICTED: monocarboxylate transporter 6-like [Sinocyclocheilus grahami]XP_016146358.1 PREDICTED: monocarboxylate transporter 6-like [Sinocyclocheilus grahami]XP_016146359.1 PREDICTED: monocarboxylate transporter 6-like [Sinocyclocheilus grahami]XP_016146360.1 PREDICTED: monocarboxylate transporter 6-like [Sinocyclocheilus grahami]
MTEGVEIHQARANSADAATTAVTQSRTSSLQAVETDPGSEEPDQQEEESSSFPEVQHHSTGGAEDSGGGSVAPDGGWGWVVVAATVLVLAMTLAFPSCIGIFYTDLQNDFQASNTETSWVPAIMIAVLHAGGPICSVLVECLGCRATIIIGGILSGLGMAASSFAQTLVELYITAGIITGMGLSLSFQPSITMVGHYFVRRRVFANALSSTGTALGLSTLPLLANYLLSSFGWRGSFLVLGGVLLNCCVCGAIMRPLGAKPQMEARTGQMNNRQLKTNCLPISQERAGLKGRLQATLSTIMSFLRRHMAFDLLCSNPYFCAYALGLSWMMLGFVVPLVYLVPYATAYGMEQDRAALLMAILGLINITVRPVTALVFGLPRFRGSHNFAYLFATAVLINGLSNCICGMATNFPVLLAYVMVYGFSMSLIGSLVFTVLMDTVEMSCFPSALGLISIMESIMLLLGPPLAGILVDSTRQYSYVFFACSINGSTAGLFIMLSFYWLDRRKDSEVKSSFTHKDTNSLKPSIKMTIDCDYSPVPLHSNSVRDMETDV